MSCLQGFHSHFCEKLRLVVRGEPIFSLLVWGLGGEEASKAGVMGGFQRRSRGEGWSAEKEVGRGFSRS